MARLLGAFLYEPEPQPEAGDVLHLRLLFARITRREAVSIENAFFPDVSHQQPPMILQQRLVPSEFRQSDGVGRAVLSRQAELGSGV